MLRELSVRSNLQGVGRAACHYSLVVLVGALIWAVFSGWGVVGAMPLMAVQGYFVAFLFMAVHETAHKTAFRSREPQPCGRTTLGLLSYYLTNITACFTGTITATLRIRTRTRS